VFTGLVLGRGRIAARQSGRSESLLTIESAVDLGEPLARGESVAVSGVCLTVNALGAPRVFSAYASAETLRASTLGRQDDVNLERALRLSDRLGGHLVLGHVDGLGRLESLAPAGQSLKCVFSFPPELAPYIVAKGSIAIDGVSLTVNEANESRFTVNLIPATAVATTLSGMRPGREVNLETDILARHVKRLLETGAISPAGAGGAAGAPSAGLTIEELVKKGY
jgi:riboflavin synthase